MTHDFIRIYTQIEQAQEWITKYRGCLPVFACVLGFTETGLIPGISAAGRTCEDRKYTACADAEFLYYGSQHQPQYPLPPLAAGASPVILSRAVVEALNLPVYLFNAGLPQPPAVPAIDLGGYPARCLSQGAAMELATVHHLFQQGLVWGERLSKEIQSRYCILSECVVGGTTTALAILTGLGVPALGKVNSSHPVCNHTQKWAVVETGLLMMRKRLGGGEIGRWGEDITPSQRVDPLELIAAVGDPMQVVVAVMAIALSRSCGVLLAGGTQMLAVYALMSAIAQAYALSWRPEEVVVGTTRWVAEDSTGGTIELAQLIGKSKITPLGVTPPLIATELSFADSRYPQLRAYEQGFVKEGVGAGGACIAAHLVQGWEQDQLLQAIEAQLEQFEKNSSTV
ncbi:nicotinate mononucleotide-dependent phosphoribosyltransferase CobT [Brasilonema sp. UFV-L1]|uniref:nicotinate mononucleotide-dependent phosphoribosyltransferase CobT n=1 Tax=Brasilonema sp. UFV-L1 TaxID=2234130 RepID=UPI00145DF1B6|nr:TIGR00303 family protein [Brasilonema sp. UFV-L1]NMG05351.1 TIGR00303 family protein [Brasilonema sp. UFV-L1]